MTDTLDALNDPRLRATYRGPRPVTEICGEKHYHHMRSVRQDKWLEETLARADERKAKDDAALEEYLEEYRAQLDAPPKAKKARKRAS